MILLFRICIGSRSFSNFEKLKLRKKEKKTDLNGTSNLAFGGNAQSTSFKLGQTVSTPDLFWVPMGSKTFLAMSGELYSGFFAWSRLWLIEFS